MRLQPAAYLRTTLPLDLSQLETLDSGRYHSIWLPDHMVSFWRPKNWKPRQETERCCDAVCLASTPEA